MLNWPPEVICVVTACFARRYLEGKAIWGERYAKTVCKIAPQREQHVRWVQRDSEKLLAGMEM